MAGKGSKPRPYSVNQKTFATNWNNIFTRSVSKDKDWYLIAINHWHKWYFNPKTGEHKNIPYK
jgi:hypothetical protein